MVKLRLSEIPLPSSEQLPGSSVIVSGKVFPPQQHILLYSSGEWEEFILEWVHYQKSQYQKVLRLTGANDQGIDIAGFIDNKGFEGIWDLFQCKHYEKALTLSDGLKEIAKILWHSFNGSYKPPRKFYFVAPKGCGIKLNKILLNKEKLKSTTISEWENTCSRAITSTQSITLDGTFREYVDTFDFSIFSSHTTLEIIDEHAKTPYHTVRFGGGLKPRPIPDPVPNEIAYSESRYIRQLFNAYGDHKKIECLDLSALIAWLDLQEHFHRQREYFYHAEALRNFARDTVPPGTFEELQSEIHSGVIEVEASAYPDGFVRLNAVSQAATALQLTANALITVLKIQDRRGICHQLANEDRLLWIKL